MTEMSVLEHEYGCSYGPAEGFFLSTCWNILLHKRYAVYEHMLPFALNYLQSCNQNILNSNANKIKCQSVSIL